MQASGAMGAGRQAMGQGGGKKINKRKLALIAAALIAALAVEACVEASLFSWRLLASSAGSEMFGSSMGAFAYFSACGNKARSVADPSLPMLPLDEERFQAARLDCVIHFDSALLDKASVSKGIDQELGSSPLEPAIAAMASLRPGSRPQEIMAAAMADPLSRSSAGALLELGLIQSHQSAALRAGRPELAARDKVLATQALAQGQVVMEVNSGAFAATEAWMPMARAVSWIVAGRADFVSRAGKQIEEATLKQYWKTQHPEQVAAAKWRLEALGVDKGLDLTRQLDAEAQAWARARMREASRFRQPLGLRTDEQVHWTRPARPR